MNKIFIAILALTITSAIFISCTKEEPLEQTETKSVVTSFNRTKVKEGSEIYVINKMKTSELKFQKYLDGLIYTVDMDLKTVVITKENESGYIKCNLIKNSDGNYKFIILSENNLRIVEPRWYCAAKCALTGAAIAASDGPAPFMDVAAITYTIACSKDC